MQRLLRMERTWSTEAFLSLLDRRFDGKAARLARATGVHSSTALRWKEGATPHGTHIGPIAAALGVAEEALFVGGRPAEGPAAEAARLIAAMDPQRQAVALATLRMMAPAPQGVAPLPRPGEPLNDLPATEADRVEAPRPPPQKKRRSGRRPAHS